MLDKIIWPIVSGVISTFIVNWITAVWTNLSVRDRWLISLGVGIGGAVAVLLILSRRSDSKKESGSSPGMPSEGAKAKGALSDNKSKAAFEVEDAKVSGMDRVLSGNESKGDFKVKKVEIKGQSDE